MNYDLKIFTENIEPEAINQIYELIKFAPFEVIKPVYNFKSGK